MIRIITILLFFFLKFSVYAQWIPPTIVKDIDSLEIVDKNFMPILDTIISIEKKRIYYSEYTDFIITITNYNEIYIETMGLLYERQLFGLFFYNGKKFLVEKYNLGDRLFKKTEVKVKQDFIIYDGLWTNEATGEKQKKGSMLDSTRSIWSYKYNDKDKLELVEFQNTYPLIGE